MLKKLSLTKKISMIILVLYLLIAVFGNFIMPYSIDNISFDALLRPSATHLLGTDEMGHDIFSLLINGFRISIFVALISGFFSTAIGVFLATVSVYYRGWVDEVLVYISNLFIIVPEIIIIMFVAVFAKPTMSSTIIAIIFFSWSKVYKIVRAKLLAYMDKSKVRYTLLIKGSIIDVYSKLRYDLYPIIITNFILQCNKAIMYETTLSYFGVGDPLSKTWGKLIKSAMNYENLFYDDVIYWYLLPPVFCVFVFILALSLLATRED